MSALWADQTETDDRRRQERPVVLEGGRSERLARAPFLLALMLILGLGMAGLLALNTALQGQAFEASRLNQQANRLTYQQAALEKQVNDLRSTQNLAARASQLGMRPNPDPGFVRLSDGKRLGAAKARSVGGNELPQLTVKTPEQIAAAKKAAQAKKDAAEARRQSREAGATAGTGDQGTAGTDQDAGTNQDNGEG